MLMLMLTLMLCCITCSSYITSRMMRVMAVQKSHPTLYVKGIPNGIALQLLS